MRRVALCVLICACVLFGATPGHAAATATLQKTRTAPSKSATKPGWKFQELNRSTQNARWRESISTTLQQTTFAPSAPAGRYLRNSATVDGKRLPPAQMDDLDKIRPSENKQATLDGKTTMHGEFAKESTGWRPHNVLADATATTPALREERRASAYAGFHPSEDVELKLGPEYHLGASVLRPEQTGYTKDNTGSFGMGMKLKIDF